MLIFTEVSNPIDSAISLVHIAEMGVISANEE